MNILFIVILLLCVANIIFGTYLGIRNCKTRTFCFYLTNLAYHYELRRIKDPERHIARSAFDWFSSKYCYEQFLYSLKPLKLEYWFTEEELKEITR